MDTPHIRIRFQATKKSNFEVVEKLINGLNRPRLEIKPYFRFNDLYGGEAGARAYENLSSIDTATMISYLKLIPSESTFDERFTADILQYVINLHYTFNDFNYSTTQRTTLCLKKAERFDERFVHDPLCLKMNQFFRDNKKIILEILVNKVVKNELIKSIIHLKKKRSKRIESIIEDLQKKINSRAISVPKDEFIYRLIHMNKLRAGPNLPNMLEFLILKNIQELYEELSSLSS